MVMTFMARSFVFVLGMAFAFAFHPNFDGAGWLQSPAASAHFAGCYATFTDRSGKVQVEVCDDSIHLTNLSSEMLSVCFTIQFKNGETFRHCDGRLRGGNTRYPACFKCDRSDTGGAVRVSWETVR